jgi:hypothetical protein
VICENQSVICVFLTRKDFFTFAARNKNKEVKMMNSTFKALVATTFLFAMMLYSKIETTDNDNNASQPVQNEQVDETVSTLETERSLK